VIRYIIKRLLWMIPVILGVTLIVMLLLELTPGDPARQLLGNFATEEEIADAREVMGLNKPLLTRYVDYLGGVLHGNLGVSFFTKDSVWNDIMVRFPYTLLVVTISMLLAIVTGIPIGVYAATHQYSWKDNASIVMSLFCVSMPNFWFALILVNVFATKLGWVPPLGIESWKSWILPAISLSIGYSATLARQTRSSMLEQIRQDYVTTARAKGQSERKVIYKHALKNAMIPIITIIGSVFGVSLGGAVIAETIFAIPGLGSYTLSALTSRDYPVVQGSVLYFAVMYSVILLLVDLVYTMVDPRIRSQFISGKKRIRREKKTDIKAVR
jgi:peptide/nickel transport system permease protein